MKEHGVLFLELIPCFIVGYRMSAKADIGDLSTYIHQHSGISGIVRYETIGAFFTGGSLRQGYRLPFLQGKIQILPLSTVFNSQTEPGKHIFSRTMKRIQCHLGRGERKQSRADSIPQQFFCFVRQIFCIFHVVFVSLIYLDALCVFI